MINTTPEIAAEIERIRARLIADGRPVWSDDDLRATAERNLIWRAERTRAEAAEARGAAIRETLKRAARVARKMGLGVRASKDRAGRISSYYVIRAEGADLRISDHEIPANARREFMAEAHGSFGYDGYRGPQLLIDRARSETWLRRAIVLALAGRR